MHRFRDRRHESIIFSLHRAFRRNGDQGARDSGIDLFPRSLFQQKPFLTLWDRPPGIDHGLNGPVVRTVLRPMYCTLNLGVYQVSRGQNQVNGGLTVPIPSSSMPRFCATFE
ncbi:hypothetical protein PENANT_c070G03319 [Penicillium antarcticum]|uniref:Uncharacterized protein n=1 Tax=Penicillium antarcticum TaxID=416450 RepID=A0A1V6PPU5_9EURO|nr:hypothetical protein PENANT_c070G03319 [Penicillium antarcticum]